MNETQLLINSMKEYIANFSLTKEQAQQELIRMGFITPDGQLTPEYGGPKLNKSSKGK